MVAAAAALALTACGNAGGGAAPTTGPVYFGVSGPVTGPNAEYGRLWKQGFDLALAKINAAGGINGRPVALKWEDSQSDPKQTGGAHGEHVWPRDRDHRAPSARRIDGCDRRVLHTECLASYAPFLDRVRREVQNDLHVVGTVRQHLPILFQGYPSGQHSFKPCGVCSRQRGRSL